MPTDLWPPLPRTFYERDPVTVARDLLGAVLVSQTAAGTVAGHIVEVEAYLPENDPANHAHRGRTRKNASMFGPPGHAYVYPIHARHCFNVVVQPIGVPSAVLVRAVEPIQGLHLMHQRRSSLLHNRPMPEHELARGPGNVCTAFAIDRSLDSWDLTQGQRLWLAAGNPTSVQQIAVSPRIGVTAARELPLRFYLVRNPCVSGKTWRQRQPSPRTEGQSG
ncbi:MAG: DNA-3-methyladenine glycosylase [Gemmataceae bacterium]